MNVLTDFQKGCQRKSRTGRSPDAARMLWARAMQRVGAALEGRMS